MSTLADPPQTVTHRPVSIPAEGATLEGDLHIPAGAAGIVLFAHGSGSSRHSPRNRYVAEMIREAELGTLLFDLLTQAEEREDATTGAYRFNIALLADRLTVASRWLSQQAEAERMKQGYFGASTGAAAALIAAARAGNLVGAVVSRGGRPDLAEGFLAQVRCPTLFIVGGNDPVVQELNQAAFEELSCEKAYREIPGASHLFEEPGKLERVAKLSADWFAKHLSAGS